MAVERSRRFGDVFLGLVLWRALGLDELFDRLLPEGREDIRWSTVAAIHAILRLCEPSSDLFLAESLYAKTALEDLLGVPPEKLNEDRVYRALDAILPHKEAVEKHLRDRLGTLFDLDYEILLYDVTSTYFEGLAQRNPQAQRGYSRDHRPDCKQVCVALVVARGGIPLAYEVFDGNRVDVTTVKEIVTTMEARFGAARRVWVMDRGMASEDNVRFLRQAGRRYLIGASKSDLRRHEAQIAEERDWARIREDVEVKLCPTENGEELYILCRSEQRREKDLAILDRFEKRLEKRIESLKRRIAKAKKPIDRAQVDQQIGRMLQSNFRASGKYDLRTEEAPETAAGISLVAKETPIWKGTRNTMAGCYLLRTNIMDWTHDELWQTYIQLTDAEDAFRTQKSHLSIRPVWHHREDRTKAHIFVCFIAYAMWKTLELWQERARLGNSPRMLLDEFREIQSADVVLPTTDGHTLKVRCVVKPEAAQAVLLERLGIKLPRRLRMNATARSHQM
ncbi:MAG: IS1634 family transposase [Planctomycetes bacterium]|nr:IS1634 family transposase [Planctomycetota bacterium]